MQYMFTLRHDVVRGDLAASGTASLENGDGLDAGD